MVPGGGSSPSSPPSTVVDWLRAPLLQHNPGVSDASPGPQGPSHSSPPLPMPASECLLRSLPSKARCVLALRQTLLLRSSGHVTAPKQVQASDLRGATHRRPMAPFSDA
ncbi:hypothetical protein NDU88_004083 [Pleurodeles waltl]|uniref:Uncharacterized protein n=1 Tax=Pleurodeles waltl TaxID=8319 RepID=A0AAV7W3Z6_PLEWA|nr:hypothetical protein NDU88_004083 [Pleurodeles waltl]